jgi:hypothetical protein
MTSLRAFSRRTPVLANTYIQRANFSAGARLGAGKESALGMLEQLFIYASAYSDLYFEWSREAPGGAFLLDNVGEGRAQKTSPHAPSTSLSYYHPLTPLLPTGTENRAEEIDAHKDESLKKVKEGKGEWNDVLASDSESIVRSPTTSLHSL